MNKLEARLRRELPELAEALAAPPVADASDRAPAVGQESFASPGDLVEIATAQGQPSRGSGRRLALVAVVVLAVLGIAIVRVGTTTESDRLEVATAPLDFGAWSPMSNGPLATRAHVVGAWTGAEAVFWAGTNLDRNFAYTDGAAYDPIADTWRNLVVPGWGHPGLTSTYLDGQVYSAAKGGATRLDPVLGRWADLADVDGMLLATVVATDDAIWGLGPVDHSPEGPQRLAIARYDPAGESWVAGPTFAAPASAASVIDGLVRLETTVLWTGAEIVVFGQAGSGLAFDPDTDSWRSFGPPVVDAAHGADGTGRVLAAMTNAGLVALVDLGAGADGATIAGLAVAAESESGWRWTGAEVPFTDFDSVTISGAGDWLVAFSADEAPVTIHVPTGEWKRHEGAPIEGRRSPNMVWTGTSLVVWGGDSLDRNALDGALWTPAAP